MSGMEGRGRALAMPERKHPVHTDAGRLLLPELRRMADGVLRGWVWKC